MNIAFDMDDVLAAFQLGWIQHNNEKYGMKLTFEGIYDFSYALVMNITEEEVFRRIFEFYGTELIKNLIPIPGAVKTIAELSKDHTLFVLTSRPAEIAEMSRTWINAHYPNKFKEILFSGQISRGGFNHKVTKADICKEYKIDWLVEDAPLHAEHVAEAGINVALLEKPWNRNVVLASPLVNRLGDISELPSLLQK